MIVFIFEFVTFIRNHFDRVNILGDATEDWRALARYSNRKRALHNNRTDRRRRIKISGQDANWFAFEMILTIQWHGGRTYVVQ